ncbi:hypothetical protein V8D89_001620 [Ganoderma adspersum]
MNPVSPALLHEMTVSLGSTFGALLLSTYFSLMLYGLTVSQTIRYFSVYQRDIPFFKILEYSYYYLVIGYFDPLVLTTNIWTMGSNTLTMGIIIFLGQCFYVRRVYLVDRRYLPVVLFVVTLMLFGFGLTTADSVRIFTNKMLSIEGSGPHMHWIAQMIFAVTSVVDLTLTGTFIFILRNSYTGFKRTNTVLDIMSLYPAIATSLMAYVAPQCLYMNLLSRLASSVLTIPSFICSVMFPHTFISIALIIPVTKCTFSLFVLVLLPEMSPLTNRAVYSNSVLAVLNSRQALTDHIAGRSNSGYTPPMAGILPHTNLNRSGYAHCDSIPRTVAGWEDVTVSDVSDSESVEAKIRARQDTGSRTMGCLGLRWSLGE